MTEGRLVYMSGDFVPESEARVSIFDTALMFGDMVFEMTRSYNMEPFRLRHHLERLYAGIKPTFPISTLQGLPQSATELPDVAE